jgi:hypothetical protein
MTERDDELTRSDMALFRRALRQDWPIPEEVKKQLLQSLINICDPDNPTGVLASTRTRIAAAKTIAAFCDLTLKQQSLDLRREQQEGKSTDTPLAELVQEAERRAEERRRERDEGERERDGGGQPAGHRGPPG